MKIRSLVIALVIVLALSGCSPQRRSVEAFESAPMPTLNLPEHNSENAGPLVVTPTKVALGKEIEVKLEDLKPDEISGLGIALLDPAGAKISTITPVQAAQKVAVPADGKPGLYKIWLASSTFAPNTGINLVVVDVYDAVRPALRNPDPLKIVETYFTALNQKDFVLAWQALSTELSSAGRTAWMRGLEPTVESIRINKTTPQQGFKATDETYRCVVELEIKTRAKGMSLSTTSRTTRHVLLRKESGGWRIDRITALP
ncbi:MAG: hypothetical protein ACM3ZQ_08730 [Bacillota bacterium]